MKYLSLILLFFTVACSADYNVNTFPNGYKYNHWGNNFISREAEGEERQVIHSQVIDYAREQDYLLVTQKTTDDYLETGSLQEPLKLYFWLLDMNSHQKQRFQSIEAFKIALKAKGIDVTFADGLKQDW